MNIEEKNSDESEGENHCWYLTTVGKNGSNHVTQACNRLSNVWNQSRGAVLAEPFPGTVIQGVILVYVIINNQLKVLSSILSTQTTRLEP